MKGGEFTRHLRTGMLHAACGLGVKTLDTAEAALQPVHIEVRPDNVNDAVSLVPDNVNDAVCRSRQRQ